MKKLFFMLAVIAAFFCAPTVAGATTIPATESKSEKMSATADTAAVLAYNSLHSADIATLNAEAPEAPTAWDWVAANWGKIVLLLAGIWEVVVRIWPTAADLSIVNKLLAFLKWVADWVPNLRLGGGRH